MDQVIQRVLACAWTIVRLAHQLVELRQEEVHHSSVASTLYEELSDYQLELVRTREEKVRVAVTRESCQLGLQNVRDTLEFRYESNDPVEQVEQAEEQMVQRIASLETRVARLANTEGSLEAIMEAWKEDFLRHQEEADRALENLQEVVGKMGVEFRAVNTEILRILAQAEDPE